MAKTIETPSIFKDESSVFITILNYSRRDLCVHVLEDLDPLGHHVKKYEIEAKAENSFTPIECLMEIATAGKSTVIIFEKGRNVSAKMYSNVKVGTIITVKEKMFTQS